MIRFLLLFILLTFNSLPISAQEIQVNSNTDWPLSLSNNSYVFKDVWGSLTFEEFQLLPTDSLKLIKEERPVFGFTTTIHWYKTFLINTDSLSIRQILQFGDSNLNELQFYHVLPNGTIQTVELGSSIPTESKQYQLNENTIEIVLEPGLNQFIFRMKANGVLAPLYELTSSSSLLFSYLSIRVMYGLLLGVLIFSICYNLVIYFVVKDLSYLYFILNQFFYVLVVLALSGIGAEYIWASFREYSPVLHRFAIYMTGIMGSLFIQSFLKTKENTPKLHQTFNLFIGIYLFGIVSIVFGFYSKLASIITALLLLNVILSLVAAVVIYKKDYKPARFYILARALLLISVFLNFLTSLKLLPYIEIIVKSHYIAGGLEAILISFALADRIKMITYEAEKAKNSQLQEQLRAEEAEYRAKTAELQVHAAEIQARAIEQENARKSNELEQARTMQMAMLPKIPPFLDDYDISMHIKTATEVGGDYYDFFEQSKGDMIIAIGDASGHGLTAGVMVTITKTALSFMKSDSLSNLMNELNKGIHAIRPNRMNMAMRLVHISRDTISMSTAAMPDVMYFNSETKKTELITQPGLPLGSFSKSSYEEIVLPLLKKGEFFVMVSDGVVEHRNVSGEEYGYDSIQKVIEKCSSKTSDQIIDELLADLSSFHSLEEIEDDLTYMVIKKK